MDGSLVVDLQCIVNYRCQLIVKELTAYAFDRLDHYVFKPPINFYMTTKSSRVNRWLCCNKHKLNHTDGDVDYDNLQTILNELSERYTHFYVKGLQKKKFIEKFTNKPVINMEDYDCPRIDILLRDSCDLSKDTCLFHKDNHNCCTNNRVKVLYLWLIDNCIM